MPLSRGDPQPSSGLIRGASSNPTYFPPSYQATEDFKQRMQGVPAGRLSTGREAAMFLLALAGPESDWIFGQVFPYVGGWVT